MACPRCGSSAPPLEDHCAVCGLRFDLNRSAVGPGTLTPPPTFTGSAQSSNSDTDAAATTSLDGAALRGASGDATTISGAPFQYDQMTVSLPGLPRHDVPSPLSVGQDFGSRYHIIRLLGAGGMGAVYQAWDKILEVAVAVKVIRPQEGMNPKDTQHVERRFKRELLLARQVTHTNVVRIHDLG